MTREEYFICLESYLKSLTYDECKEALQYYEDYFDEAGPENEAEVIEKLGSPKQLAETILNSEGISKSASYGTASEKTNTENDIIKRSDDNNKKAEKKTTSVDDKTLKIILAIIVIIVGFPIVVSIGGAILGVACGLLFGGLGLIILGVAGVIGGIITMFKAGIGLGIMTVGITLIIASIGLFFLFILFVICKYFVPVCYDGIQKIWNAIVR